MAPSRRASGGRWAKWRRMEEDECEEDAGNGLKWGSKTWCESWSAGWKSSWKGDTWSADYSRSWSGSWSRSWEDSGDEERSDMKSPAEQEPARRVTLLRARSNERGQEERDSEQADGRGKVGGRWQLQRGRASAAVRTDSAPQWPESPTCCSPSPCREEHTAGGRASSSGRQQAYRVQKNRRHQQWPDSPARGHSGPSAGREERLVDSGGRLGDIDEEGGGDGEQLPSPASPLSVGSSVIPDGQDAADDHVQEEDGSASDVYVALPVEPLDDSADPGLMDLEANKIRARRRAAAAEAAKFAAPQQAMSPVMKPATLAPTPTKDATSRASPTTLRRASPPKTPQGRNPNRPAASKSAPAKKRQKTMATATPGASNSSWQADGGSEKVKATHEVTASVAAPARKVPEAPPPAKEVFSQAEEDEFKGKILEQLRRLDPGIDEEDAELVAELIVVMVNDGRPGEEMVKELHAIMQNETEPFVAWVEACKDGMLSRRRTAEAPLRAQLTPNPMSDGVPVPPTATSSSRPNEGSKRRRKRRRAEGENKYVVRTSKLVLQPRPSADNSDGNSDSEDGSIGSSEDASANNDEGPSPDEKRLKLLGEMTTRLQSILLKLSDKTLDDLSREKYQVMAQSIQAAMSKCNKADKSAIPAGASDGFES